MTFQESKKVLDDYIAEISEWYKHNQLHPTPSFNELAKKELWGKYYQEDLHYFRLLNDVKAKLMALKSYFGKIKSETPVVYRKDVDIVIDYIQDQIRVTETKLYSAKEQLNYYQSIVYVVRDFSYGDYA